jgi:hypothetical protein
MKTIILIAMLSLTRVCLSQENRISKSGTIIFEGSVASFEEVKATNNNVTFVLNPMTGEIACLALVKGFRFKVALMEEHFNENYIESDQYPKAIFKGKIEGFDVNKLTETPKNFIIKGTLALHGKSRDINVSARISKLATGINLASDFSVNASDFNISIPSIVKSKVSNKINIRIAAVLK